MTEDIISKTIHALSLHYEGLKNKKVTAGFDGFIDSVVKVIKKKDPAEPLILFRTMKELSAYMAERDGKNFSLELETVATKLGGNMPIMANALAQFEIQVNCIGTLGLPSVHPLFAAMPSACNLYTFANPGTTTALEFDHGKMILASMGELDHAGWLTIKEHVGIENLIKIFAHNDLIGLFNWSELEKSSDIWKGLLKDIFPLIPAKDRVIFFDLSDCSKKSASSIEEALQLIRSFTKYGKVMLSLNHNEAEIIHRILGKGTPVAQLSELGANIHQKAGIDVLILHNVKQALAWYYGTVVKQESFFIENPKISTGAGDNFNAGFCLGQLIGLDVHASLLLAHAVSAHYVKYGKSPDKDELLDFLASV